MSIYFDNSSTTQIDSDVLHVVEKYSFELYANPSAMHKKGFLVEEDIKTANNKISEIINAEPSEIIWTSGGSESNNFAIRGYVDSYKRSGNRIITTKIEHPSVYKVFEKLKSEGFDVIYLDVDKYGQINYDALSDSIDDNTILVSVMYVNNEIGAVQDIDSIGKLIKDKNNKTAFHVDFVQGFSKYKIDVKKSKIDLLTFSSHKFHGPKGVGVLYKNKNIRLSPLILGGNQQNSMRAGTLNSPGIMGTVKAAEIAYNIINSEFNKLKHLRDYTIDKLNNLNEKYGIISINTCKDERFAPHIVSVSFKGIRAEVMLHSLETYDIYVSAGSACSSHDKKLSSTLLAIGLKPNIAESTIRLSFGKYNSSEEIDKFISCLDILLPKLILKV